MRNNSPRLLLSDPKGRIFEHSDLDATGMKAGYLFRLNPNELIRLPAGSQLFKLPDRLPVGYDPQNRSFVNVPDACSVAAFAAPGYTITYSASYSEDAKVDPLPLFSYGACAIYENEVHVAAIRVDKGLRHDPTLIDLGLVKKRIPEFKKLFPANRLIRHLSRCATVHGCPNAQNFFRHRYEAPLPVSPSCNAACWGCISYQKGKIQCSQPRIKFIPSAEEVAQVALFHITNVKDPIVSFGQGCEGEPLLQGRILEASIKLIRKITPKGTININTNGSRPEILARLFDAGLDSARISLNSARERYYSRYYKPRGYTFKDVIESIKVSKRKGAFLSLNYLTMPGFTDSHDEVAALTLLVEKYRVDMIQWRNLNYDPLLYFRQMGIGQDISEMIGVRETMGSIKKRFPNLKMGYFNPVPLGASRLGYGASPRAAASRRR